MRPRMRTTYLFTAALTLSIFSGNFDQMAVPFPLDRVAWVLTTASLVHDGRQGHLLSGRLRPVHASLLGYTLLAVTSAIWWGTIFSPLAAFALLDRVIMPAVAFLVAPLACPTRESRIFVAKSFTVLGAYLGLTSLFYVAGLDALVHPRYILNPDLGIHLDRARGPFLESAANGLALVICAVMSLVLIQSQVTSWRWRLAAVAGVSLCVSGAVVTYTRSIWIAMPVGLVVVLASDERSRPHLPKLTLAVVSLLAAAIMLLAPLRDALAGRFSDQTPLDDRATTNDTALRLLWDNPLTGVGWGRYLEVVVDSVRQLDLVPLTTVNIEAHNVLLARGAELGLPGAVLWISTVLLGPGLVALLRTEHDDLQRWRYGIRGIITAYLIVAMFTPLSYPFANLAVFALAGIAATGYITDHPHGVPQQGVHDEEAMK